MPDDLETLPGRDAVLAAADRHPYVLLTATGDVTGYRADGLLGWVASGPRGPVVCGLGDPARALAFARWVRDRDGAGGASWTHLPQLPRDTAAGVLPVVRQDDWDFLYTAVAPPATPDGSAVRRLDPGADDEIAALLAEAFPSTTSRPGDPRVRCWYGIRDGGRLVAAGADRSRGGVGFLAGIAVHPTCRRRRPGGAAGGPVR